MVKVFGVSSDKKLISKVSKNSHSTTKKKTQKAKNKQTPNKHKH